MLEGIGKLSGERRFYLGELLLESHRVDLMKKLGIAPDQLKEAILENGEHFINEFR